MKIRIVAIGKIKETYLNLGIAEYIKRIKPYANIEIDEVKDEPLSENPNESEIQTALKNEADRVLKIIKVNEKIILIDLHGKELDSPGFARFLEKKFEIFNSSITFVIGGSYGIHDSLRERSSDGVCLSKMTFLHQMTRLILLEQIYRSFKIINNETYHK